MDDVIERIISQHTKIVIYSFGNIEVVNRHTGEYTLLDKREGYDLMIELMRHYNQNPINEAT